MASVTYYSVSSYRKGLFLLASLLLSISLLLLASLTSSAILQETMIPQQQRNMVLVHVAFASTLVNSNGSSTVIPGQSSNFSLYNNSTFGIQFQSPNDWNKIETLAGRTIFIEFASRSTNATGGNLLPARVAISIEKGLGNVTTLQEYSEAADKLLNKILGNFTAKSQPITLSGLPAISKIITTKHPISGIGVSIAQVFTIKNNNAYSITYTVPTSTYYRYLPVVQQILNSFQIVNTPQTLTPTSATPPVTGASRSISPPPTSTVVPPPISPPSAIAPSSNNTAAITSPPIVPSQAECVPGYHWDSSQKQCVK